MIEEEGEDDSGVMMTRGNMKEEEEVGEEGGEEGKARVC